MLTKPSFHPSQSSIVCGGPAINWPVQKKHIKTDKKTTKCTAYTHLNVC